MTTVLALLALLLLLAASWLVGFSTGAHAGYGRGRGHGRDELLAIVRKLRDDPAALEQLRAMIDD